MPFDGPVIPFGAMVEYHPISAKDQSTLHQFGSQVLPDTFLGCASYAGRVWKGDIMVADIEELEQMDASELHTPKAQCEGSGKANGRCNFHITSRRWNGLTFYQTRSNAIIIQETLPAYCVPKVVRMKIGEVFYEKVFMSPRPPPKISLKHEWKRELGSDHAQRAEAGQLSGSFQSNQPTLNPICERSGRLDITHDVISVQDERKTSLLRRSMLILFAKNLVLQSERSDLLQDPFRENPFMRRL